MTPARTQQEAEARVRRALRDRGNRLDSADLDPRVVRAIASENDLGPWVERNRKGGRRDAIRWRVRLADVAARQTDRLARWGVQ